MGTLRSAHSPARIFLSERAMFRAMHSMRPMACSATESEFWPGAFVTTTPWRVAASRSTELKPTPVLAMCLRCVAAARVRSL